MRAPVRPYQRPYAWGPDSLSLRVAAAVGPLLLRLRGGGVADLGEERRAGDEEVRLALRVAAGAVDVERKDDDRAREVGEEVPVGGPSLRAVPGGNRVECQVLPRREVLAVQLQRADASASAREDGRGEVVYVESWGIGLDLDAMMRTRICMGQFRDDEDVGVL